MSRIIFSKKNNATLHKDLIMNLERATAWVEFMQTKPELPSKYSSEIEVIKKNIAIFVQINHTFTNPTTSINDAKKQ